MSDQWKRAKTEHIKNWKKLKIELRRAGMHRKAIAKYSYHLWIQFHRDYRYKVNTVYEKGIPTSRGLRLYSLDDYTLDNHISNLEPEMEMPELEQNIENPKVLHWFRSLTPTEKAIVFHRANGLTSKQIAEILHTKEGTVNNLVCRAKRKFKKI